MADGEAAITANGFDRNRIDPRRRYVVLDEQKKRIQPGRQPGSDGRKGGLPDLFPLIPEREFVIISVIQAQFKNIPSDRDGLVEFERLCLLQVKPRDIGG